MSDLPHGWEWATLGDISTSITNGIFVSRPGEMPNGVPILRISSVRTMRLDLNDSRYSALSRKKLAADDKLLESGDLLFTRYSGSREFVGACARVPDDVAALTYPDKLIRVRLREIDSKYMEAAFASQIVRSSVENALRTTAGQVGISGSALKKIQVPVAPLEEQRRIIAALDEHLTHLAAGGACVDSATTTLANLRTSALNQYHSDALRLGARLVRIGDLADTQLGKMLDARNTTGTPTTYLRNVNVRWHSFNLEGLLFVALTDAEKVKFSLRDGDVLVCEGGEPGRCAVWRGQVPGAAFQKALHRVRVRNALSPEWLCMMLEAEVRSGRIEALLTGSTIKHLPQEKLRSIQIPVPDTDLQKSFVREFTLLSDNAGYTARQLALLTTRSSTLRRSLLSDAFAGRLVPQDPADEPASVLLDRISAERAVQPKPRRTRRTAAS